MANELMTKVKELLELGGVDEATVKAITEKLISDTCVLLNILEKLKKTAATITKSNI